MRSKPKPIGEPRFMGVQFLGGILTTIYIIYAQDEIVTVGKVKEVRTKTVHKRMSVDQIMRPEDRATYATMAVILEKSQAWFLDLSSRIGATLPGSDGLAEEEVQPSPKRQRRRAVESAD